MAEGGANYVDDVVEDVAKAISSLSLSPKGGKKLYHLTPEEKQKRESWER